MTLVTAIEWLASPSLAAGGTISLLTPAKDLPLTSIRRPPRPRYTRRRRPTFCTYSVVTARQLPHKRRIRFWTASSSPPPNKRILQRPSFGSARLPRLIWRRIPTALPHAPHYHSQ